MSHVEPTSFYVTLLSNTWKSLYPDQTIATITVELAGPIELFSSVNWEMRLCEFSYPPKNVGSFKPTTIVIDCTGLMYCDLILPQYLGRALVSCKGTFIYIVDDGSIRVRQCLLSACREADV